MTQVPRSPRKPLVTRTACPAPGDVLFKRSVSSAGIAAPGETAATTRGPKRIVASVSSQSVVSVFSRLRTCTGSVDSVASQFQSPVAFEFQRPVEFASRYEASGPKGTLIRVLAGLRRKAIAAKVQRGRRRLDGSSGQRVRVPALQSVASVLVRFASVASQQFQLPRVVSPSVLSWRVASVGVASVSVPVASVSQSVAFQSVSVASELCQSVQRSGCARVLQ